MDDCISLICLDFQYLTKYISTSSFYIPVVVIWAEQVIQIDCLQVVDLTLSASTPCSLIHHFLHISDVPTSSE